jgi:hypothetical protein
MVCSGRILHLERDCGADKSTVGRSVRPLARGLDFGDRQTIASNLFEIGGILLSWDFEVMAPVPEICKRKGGMLISDLLT